MYRGRMPRPATTSRRTARTGRAAPMAPDERRRAIVDVVVPLLLEHGEAVTTKQIAEAAGIAEGTIFRVFPDKAALLMAAAEETMNPSAGREELAAALDGISDLRERVLVATEMAHARSERVVAVMMALRGVWTAQAAERRDHPHRPPEFMRSSRRAVLDRLTDVFEPHRAELTVTPRKAALLLHALVLGARHPGVEPEAVLTPREIADALLDGIATPSSKETD
jgi:AcrR family transcriptional regulator